MKNSFFKTLNILLSIGIIFSISSNVFSGSELSVPKKSNISREEQEALEISRDKIAYFPTLAADGGKAYFWALNGVINKEGFDAFTKKYKNIKNNTKSAKLLPDSERNEKWITMSARENIYDIYTLKFFEELEDPDSSKYLLRIDEENNLIYTVRKSGDLYLFTFYVAKLLHDVPMLSRSCFVISSDICHIEKILLPVDKELLN